MSTEAKQGGGEIPTSRLIVKNIPRHLSEERLREHFGKQGIVTDAKIMRKNDKTRNFAFVGYKTEAEAIAARKHFNGTFFDTSKMAIEFARPQGDPNLPRAWSKFSKGSSAYAALHKDDSAKGKAAKKAADEAERERKNEEIERKKNRFRDFLKVIGATKDNKQSWNDNFAAFMADEGSGLLHTSKAAEDEKAKKRKAKQDEKDKKAKEKEEATQEEEAPAEKDIDEQRLYVMNLPFIITHDELRELFSKFGEVEDIEIPLRRGGTGFGFAFVRFTTVEGAVSAFAELDKTYFQGRKLHILPAQAKPPKPVIEAPPLPEEPNEDMLEVQPAPES